MLENVKVSIITPVYNSSKFLENTAKSVFEQSFKNWEWLLVDDYSSDNSKEILKFLAHKDHRVRVFFQEENQGSAAARNLALSEATGRYIAFLDSDDLWNPEKLKRQLEFMFQNNAVFSHTSYGFIDEEGNKIKSTYKVSSVPVTYEMLLRKTEIGCLTVMYDKKVLGELRMPNIRKKQDYGLWLKILKDGFVSMPLQEELSYYRQVKGSVTNNKFKLITKHYYFMREIEGLSVFQSLKYTFFWGTNGFSKYYLK